MSLFALYQNQVCHGQPVTREQAVQRPLGQPVPLHRLPPHPGRRPADAHPAPHAGRRDRIATKMELLAHNQKAPEADLTYISPTTLDALLAARTAHPQAQLVAGGTDAGLWVTKQHRQLGQVLDVTRVAELRQITEAADHTAIGAAVRLQDAFDALVQRRPQLHSFATRFAGLPVRNAGTLGATSPMARQLATPCRCSLPCAPAWCWPAPGRAHAGAGRPVHRLPPERAGARRSAGTHSGAPPGPQRAVARLQGVQALRRRHFRRVPGAVPAPGGRRRARRLHRRWRCGRRARLCAPGRGRLTGQPWNETAVQQAAQALQTEFTPCPTCAPAVRTGAPCWPWLVQRFWLESPGATPRCRWRASGWRNRHEHPPHHGASHTRTSARAQVAGAAHYIDDLPEVKGTLYAAPIPRPWRTAASTVWILAPALAMPGVRAVVLAQDIPGDPVLAAFAHDEPILPRTPCTMWARCWGWWWPPPSWRRAARPAPCGRHHPAARHPDH